VSSATGRPGVALTVYLAGARVVVVGGGPVAAAKLRAPLEAGADVHVVAPEAGPDVRAAAAAGRLTWRRGAFARSDLDGAALAVAATATPAVNAEVAAAARKCGVLCVRVDGGGSADFAATLQRGPLTLAVATGGTAPALARRLRAELAERYDEAYGQLAALLGALRADPAVRGALAPLTADERAGRWRCATGPDILALIRAGHVDRARELALTCLLSSSA
jgi:precorrin-2 dehydrogenase / sirohydrochlorin ferrochelatase